ncbi:hypothetical protein [Eubacterium sp.]|uniref:hypothetical protein n=1 Tax=Eubacterium sp. TaxID=142586 RepID=UPI0035204501
MKNVSQTALKSRASDDKLYVSAIFDCFDVTVLGLAMDTNMKAPLCVADSEQCLHITPGE